MASSNSNASSSDTTDESTVQLIIEIAYNYQAQICGDYVRDKFAGIETTAIELRFPFGWCPDKFLSDIKQLWIVEQVVSEHQNYHRYKVYNSGKSIVIDVRIFSMAERFFMESSYKVMPAFSFIDVNRLIMTMEKGQEVVKTDVYGGNSERIVKRCREKKFVVLNAEDKPALIHSCSRVCIPKTAPVAEALILEISTMQCLGWVCENYACKNPDCIFYDIEKI